MSWFEPPASLPPIDFVPGDVVRSNMRPPYSIYILFRQAQRPTRAQSDGEWCPRGTWFVICPDGSIDYLPITSMDGTIREFNYPFRRQIERLT